MLNGKQYEPHSLRPLLVDVKENHLDLNNRNKVNGDGILLLMEKSRSIWHRAGGQKAKPQEQLYMSSTSPIFRTPKMRFWIQCLSGLGKFDCQNLAQFSPISRRLSWSVFH